MIKFVDDTVFNTPAEWIVNTINCEGVMGKGLALEFALRYPELKEDYIKRCKSKTVRIGKIYAYEKDNVKVINFPTKNKFRYESKYEWIECGLIDFIKRYKELNIKSIAFPYLGCSNGGLDKYKVRSIMEEYLSIEDLDVYICSSIKVSGIEKEMIENLKLTKIEDLIEIAKLNKNQKEYFLKYYLEINRFYDLLSIPTIGTKTYEKLFKNFYNQEKKVTENKNVIKSVDTKTTKYKQLNIFDCLCEKD